MANITKDKNEVRSMLYKRWSSMKNRCKNPNANHYHRYGGRGISVSPEWESFENFYTDMQQGFEWYLQLDRIDNNGNYSKENCRWVTQEENARNRDCLASSLPHDTSVITASVYKYQKEDINNLSEELGCSKSELYRNIIKFYFDNHRK